jgi:hypothetical protein
MDLSTAVGFFGLPTQISWLAASGVSFDRDSMVRILFFA